MKSAYNDMGLYETVNTYKSTYTAPSFDSVVTIHKCNSTLYSL